LYDIYDIDAGKYMLPKEREDFCNRNQITHVPIISIEATANTIDFILKEAEGKSRLCDLVEREGVVYKSCTTDVSFKVISNSFLLKTES